MESGKRHAQAHRLLTQLPLCLIESNILPRLPAKSVGRCRCVCKQWKTFLSTDTFARMHLHHVTINDYKLAVLNVSTTPDPNAEFILATLDGLVCLASSEMPTTLAFWNPLTGAYKKLSCGFYFDFCKRSAFDAIGFYVDSSYDYKLLCLRFGAYMAYIYSHRLDSWRMIEVPETIRFISNSTCSPATFWDHCLYFIMTSTFSRIIICFDVKTETFRKIRFPPDHLRYPKIRYPGYYPRYYCSMLAILNGCIHLCVFYNKNLVGLWRMDGDDGWVEVAANNLTRQHIGTSTGNVLEENSYSIENMIEEDFTRHWCYFCSPSCKDKSKRIMYVETLVSPDL